MRNQTILEIEELFDGACPFITLDNRNCEKCKYGENKKINGYLCSYINEHRDEGIEWVKKTFPELFPKKFSIDEDI